MSTIDYANEYLPEQLLPSGGAEGWPASAQWQPPNDLPQPGGPLEAPELPPDEAPTEPKEIPQPPPEELPAH